MRDPDFTLSAGPTMAYPRVLAAQARQITYHYDPAFLELFRRTERKAAEVFLTSNDVLLMQGEAVLGLEAAARGLVTPAPRGRVGAQSHAARAPVGHAGGRPRRGARARRAHARGAARPARHGRRTPG